MIRRGDRVTVTDPADEYHGLSGMVAHGPYAALISGQAMVDVQLDGRDSRDLEGFYTAQLQPRFSVAV